ncbi:MAG TPA: patatin-like phospholipase family protein [Candidatus Eisenbacteria bacterium]|nr:patatin-like phospholipase family protein [Candidatus Eisenbacteria bacterium]
MSRSLRSDLPYRRIAVILSGGGALGAYEVGVLRAIRRVGLEPAIVAGASAGALNAVCWVAAGLATSQLEDVWRKIEPATIGFRWSTLAGRAAGAFLVVLGAFEGGLAIIGSPELSLGAWLRGRGVEGIGAGSVLLDVLAWALVSAAGVAVLRGSRETEEVLAKSTAPGGGRLAHGRIAYLLGAWAGLHLLVWAVGMPWPHRFSATLFALAVILWLAGKPGRVGEWVRHLFSRLLPESRGRGLWGDAARRGVLTYLVDKGDASRLVSGAPIMILTGLSLETGRVAMFVAGAEPNEAFRARAEATLGEVVSVRTPAEVMDAAVASSAIPLFFEPASVRGREYLDAVALSTHPLRAALCADADAALVVVVSPSGGPPVGAVPKTLVELWARYLDIANWRDLQRELRDLPPDWQAPTMPRRLCVVEPEAALPGGVLAYSPRNAAALMDRGEADAWRALDQAGWLAT